MPTTAEVADAVVATLNAAPVDPPLAALRAWLPRFELGEMELRHVTVVPAGRLLQAVTRNRLQIDHRIEVAVQQKTAVELAAAVDGVMAVAERVAVLLSQPLTPLPEVVWVKTEHAPFVAPEHLAELRQVTSVVVATYRSWEAV